MHKNYIRDLKNENDILADFITSKENDKRLCLLPYSEFIKRYNQLSERQQLSLLSELERVISHGTIAKAYLLNEWQKFNFIEFVKNELDRIDSTIESETEMQIYRNIERKIESDLPINEIKEYLLKFKYNILGNKDKIELQEVNLRVFNFINNQLNYINECAKKGVERKDTINPEYRKFWEPLLSINYESGEPYMTEENFNIFMENMFGKSNEIKSLPWPDLKPIELRHGAALFIEHFGFDKKRITRILIDTFPAKFKGEFNNEYSNIRKAHYFTEEGKERFFKITT